MFRRQRGVTLIGWLVLLIPVAVVGYMGIRLVPIYLNYLSVSKSINATVTSMKDEDVSTLTPGLIRAAVGKNFETNSIDYPEIKDIAVTRDGSGWVIESKYSQEVPMFYNISMIVDFDKVGKIGS
jgi:hypothetical protein